MRAQPTMAVRFSLWSWCADKNPLITAIKINFPLPSVSISSPRFVWPSSMPIRRGSFIATSNRRTSWWRTTTACLYQRSLISASPKATDQRLTDKTLFTAFEQFIGTPAYMSPEQAQLSGWILIPGATFTGLGVLLYELLTGKTPFDAKRLVESGFDELRRIIREEEPACPSARLSTLAAEEKTTVAKRRHSEPPKLLGLIRGDLDWIVMKALEKDRNRRYATANGLAMDIERHLKDEPVTAVAPSKLYKFSKIRAAE